MLITVLGAAAGGGFPQWNCNAATSRAVRAATGSMRPATQSSVAVSTPGTNGRHAVVLNASPDIRQQIAQTTLLQPEPGAPLRSSPISAVVLTNGDVDHVAGLLSLREGQVFTLYAAERVLTALAANSIFKVLNPDVVKRAPLQFDAPFRPTGLVDVEITPFEAPGKIALYLEDEAAGPDFGTAPGDTAGLEMRDPATGHRAIYLPGCAAITDSLKARLDGTHLVLFDGTLYSDTELIDQGLSPKTGARMGHMSMAGPNGVMATLRDVRIERRVFIHINTSNPVWDPASAARADVERQGWEVAFDGMELNF